MKIDLPSVDFTSLGITKNFSVDSMQVLSKSYVGYSYPEPKHRVLFNLFTKPINIPKSEKLLFKLEGNLDTRVIKPFYNSKINRHILSYTKYFKLRQAYFKASSSEQAFSGTSLSNAIDPMLISGIETSYAISKPNSFGYLSSSTPDSVESLENLLQRKKPIGYGFITSKTIADSGSKLSVIAVAKIANNASTPWYSQQVYFSSFLLKLKECNDNLACYFIDNFLTIDATDKIFSIVSSTMANFGPRSSSYFGDYSFLISPPPYSSIINLSVQNVTFEIYYHIEDL